MSYTYEDYDAFLASFQNQQQQQQQQQQQNQQTINTSEFFLPLDQDVLPASAAQLEHDPSISNSLSTDDADDLGFNSFYTNEQQNILSNINTNSSINNNNSNNNNSNNNVNFLLSPNSLAHSSSSNSPTDQFGLNDEFNLVNDYEFKNPSINQNVKITDAKKIKIKQEEHKIKLSDALPQHSIHKKSSVSSSSGGVHIKKEKSSHNMIEKRYRTNINDKIKALRDSVPALRVLVDSADEDVDEESLEGLQPAKKSNKATILSKATEYIKHLESKNDSSKEENEQLKSKSYASSRNMTPGTSLSSSSFISSRSNSTGSTSESNGIFDSNKVLMGGLACMVGAGLSDDFSNLDSRNSLFSMPIFTYNQGGFHVLSKPFVILCKIMSLTFVLINFIVPALFKPKSSKKQFTQQQLQLQLELENKNKNKLAIDDIRNLKTIKIWSTFTNSTNENYVKNSIIRCLLLKSRLSDYNYLNSKVLDFYVEGLWNYLKEMKMSDETENYEEIKTILSLPNSNTINNEEFLVQLIKKSQNIESLENEFSIILNFYKSINETNINKVLKRFILNSIETDGENNNNKKDIVSILKDFKQNENNSLNESKEINLLFNSNEESIANFKLSLESLEINQIKNDEILLLYSSIIQDLILNKNDFEHAKKFLLKIDNKLISNFNLLGFTSLYLIILILMEDKGFMENIDNELLFKIEEISAKLRIWLGNSNGSILNFKKRSTLIDYLVSLNRKINGLNEENNNTTKNNNADEFAIESTNDNTNINNNVLKTN